MIVRWGIIGCGDIVRKRVAGGILDHPQSRLVAACRRDAAALQAFCQRFGVDRAYTRAEDLIADPGLDAVYVATPVHLHRLHTLAAAAAGKHVLVEKPMALTVAECDEMIAVCRARGVKLGVAYYRRFYPIVARMQEIVASQEIGQPLSVSAVTTTPFRQRPGEDGYWRVIPSEGGGGALMDIGSHRINLFLDFLGEPVEVKACCSTVAGGYEAEDCASLLIRFRSGAHGALQCFFGTSVAADEFFVMGTRGRLIASPLNGSELLVQTRKEQRTECHPPAANLHGPLIADFAEAILHDRLPRVTGEEGRLTNEVMQRAYRDAGNSFAGLMAGGCRGAS